MNLSSNVIAVMLNEKLFFINDTLENKISYYLLACFLIALPFAHFYSEILLSCFAIHTLIHLRKNRLALLKKKSVWVISAIFFLNLIAVTYSNYPEEGLKNVSQQLSILLFPFCFVVTENDVPSRLRKHLYRRRANSARAPGDQRCLARQ